MTFSYAEKVGIIRHLSTPSHWDNRFDMDWLMDPQRKTRSDSATSGERKRAEDTNTGQYFHTIGLDFPALKGLFYWARINAVKLVVAEDLGFDVKIAQKERQRSWAVRTDSTQHNDPIVDVPKTFAVERTDEDFLLATTAERKHDIINLGQVFFRVVENVTPQKVWRDKGFNTDMIPDSLKKGAFVNDTDGHRWRSVVLSHPAAAEFSSDAKNSLARNFDLQAGQYLAVAFDAKRLVIALRDDLGDERNKAPPPPHPTIYVAAKPRLN